MKARAIGFALLIAASAAWGQNAASKASKGTVANGNAAVQAAKPISLPLVPKGGSTANAKPTPVTAAPKSVVKPANAPKSPRKIVRRKSSPAEPAASPQSAQSGTTTITASGRRDPFVSVIRSGGEGGPGCATGKKCIVAEQVLLRGVVKAPDGFIAVVENQQRRVYFLREGDPIFNGQVVRIMSDSILFREKIIDKVGREHTREIAKRIPAGSEPLAVFSQRPTRGAAPSVGPALLAPLTSSDASTNEQLK